EAYYSETVREKGVDKVTADRYRIIARRLLNELEHSENEFTELARKRKFQIIAQQGVLDKAIDKLDSFEDCYVRAQYETYQMSLDPKDEINKQLKAIDLGKAKDAKEKAALEAKIKRLEADRDKLDEKGATEKRRKGLIDNIMKSLTRALALNDKAPEKERKKP